MRFLAKAGRKVTYTSVYLKIKIQTDKYEQ